MPARFTLEEKLRELDRELYWRGKVYPNRVAEGRMKPEDSIRYMDIMREIRDEYQDQLDARVKAQLDAAPDLFGGQP